MDSPAHKVANRLIDARQTLLNKGWIQGQYHAPTGECCLIGALDTGIDDEREYYNACQAVRVVLNNESLADWNDHPKRKKEQVIAALNQAASLIMSNEELF